MSLINQMLRDLEQREFSTLESSAFEHQSVQITTAATQQSKFWLFILVPLVAAVSTWLYQQSTLDSHTTVALKLPDLVAHHIQSPELSTVIAKPVAPKAKTEKLLPNTSTNLTNTTHHPEQFKSVPSRKVTAKQNIEKLLPHLTPAQQAEQLYKQAQQTDDSASSQTMLEKAVLLYPQHINARLLLVKLSISQARHLQAELLLDQGLKITPLDIRLVNARAQRYLQQKNTTAALIILQRLNANEIVNETYLSLLAASYQQQREFKKAVKIYHKLTLKNPDQAKFWLGLAIALDQSRQTSTSPLCLSTDHRKKWLVHRSCKLCEAETAAALITQ